MSNRRILPTTIAALLCSGMIAAGAGPVFAGDHAAETMKHPGKTATDETAMKSRQLIKISEDTMLSMRDINDARLALFEGQPEKARTEVDAALTRINVALDEAEQYALKVEAPKQDDWYVPFDTQVTLMDMFEHEDAKADTHGTANRHMRKGKPMEAVDTFKLRDEDLAISAGLVPVRFAKQHIVEAADLINKGDYYEANMALKAVDDAVIVHTVAIDEPASGDAT